MSVTFRLSFLLCHFGFMIYMAHAYIRSTLVSVQVGLLGILRYRCRVKLLENPQYAHTASATTNLAAVNMLTYSLKTSNMGTATHAMATALVMVTAHATVAVPVAVICRWLSQRKGCGSVAGWDSKSNWNLSSAADTSTEES